MKHTRIQPQTFDTALYGRDSWIATAEWCAGKGWFSGGDEPDECHLDNGVVLKLNVPLCRGCDEPIVNHVCHACEQVFLGEPEKVA